MTLSYKIPACIVISVKENHAVLSMPDCGNILQFEDELQKTQFVTQTLNFVQFQTLVDTDANKNITFSTI